MTGVQTCALPICDDQLALPVAQHAVLEAQGDRALGLGVEVLGEREVDVEIDGALERHPGDRQQRRQPAAQEKVWLSVTTGPLPRGAAIRVDAPDGSMVELLTAFGGHAGTGGATVIVPLPQSLIVGGRVQLRLTVVGAGPDHSPAQAEVKDAHLIFVPTTPP